MASTSDLARAVIDAFKEIEPRGDSLAHAT
jgi:hypothetical protein